MVGLLENAQYEQGSVRLSPGDVLVAFTDGISEAMNLDDEEWGEERIARRNSRAAAAHPRRNCWSASSTRLPGLPGPPRSMTT